MRMLTSYLVAQDVLHIAHATYPAIGETKCGKRVLAACFVAAISSTDAFNRVFETGYYDVRFCPECFGHGPSR